MRFGRNLFAVVAFFGIFLWWFYQKGSKFYTSMIFFGEMLLQSCIFQNQNIFTEARIHQKNAAGKSAAHFTLVHVCCANGSRFTSYLGALHFYRIDCLHISIHGTSFSLLISKFSKLLL